MDHSSASALPVAPQISADFADDITMGVGETLIEEMEHALKQALPQLTSIYIRPEKRSDAASFGQ